MTAEPSFEEWLTRLRANDKEAAQQLFSRYASGLIARARRHLDGRLRSKIDPEDVVQSVLSSFCARLGRGEYTLIDWDSLWGLLTRITARKCHKWREYFLAQQRDVKREQPLMSKEKANATAEPVPSAPDPMEAEALRETLDGLLHALTDLERQILLMKLEEPDVGQAEIARRLACSQAKVSRVLTFIRQRLERLRDEDQYRAMIRVQGRASGDGRRAGPADPPQPEG